MSSAQIAALAFQLGSALHFMQLPAMLRAPKLLHWSEEFARLGVLNRRLVYVVMGGLVLVVASFGAINLLHAEKILATPGLRASCTAFWAIFWAYRAAAQLFLYGACWPRDKLSIHRALCVLFAFKAALFLFALLGPAL